MDGIAMQPKTLGQSRHLPAAVSQLTEQMPIRIREAELNGGKFLGGPHRIRGRMIERGRLWARVFIKIQFTHALITPAPPLDEAQGLMPEGRVEIGIPVANSGRGTTLPHEKEAGKFCL